MKTKMGDEFRVRLPLQLLEDLRQASDTHKLDQSTIASKALYAAWKNAPDLDAIDVDSTYKGEAIRLCIDEARWLQPDGVVETKKRPDFLRRALRWFLDKN